MNKPEIMAPMSQGWEKMKDLLFRPFDMGMWFTLGFSVFLATIMDQAAGNFGNVIGNFSDLVTTIGDGSGDAEAFLREHLATIVSVGTIVLLFTLTVSYVLVWLSARGQFMFLNSVAENQVEIKRPWAEYKTEANALFLWLFAYSLIMGFFILISLGLIGWAVYEGLQMGEVTSRVILMGSLGLVILLPASLINGYITLFLKDFVVPIMYKYRIRSRQAWGVFGGLFRAAPGSFLLYGVMIWLLGIAFGIAAGVVTLITCCIAGIPYISSVVFLPIYVFLRYYSLEFLKQCGPDYDVYPVPAAPPPLPEQVS